MFMEKLSLTKNLIIWKLLQKTKCYLRHFPCIVDGYEFSQRLC